MGKRDQNYVVVVGSARERAYRTLREKIVNLELSPGTLISTQELADSLGISRTPAREAFLELQRENLLDISHQKPSMVSRIDLERVRQERFVRTALEVENMRLFAEEPPEEILQEMRENIGQQKAALRDWNFELYQELDNEFHQMPFYGTGHDLAATLISQMNGHYDRVRILIRKNQEITNDIIGEHEKLLESIEKKDVKKAVKLLRSHIQAFQPLQDKLVEQLPEWFV